MKTIERICWLVAGLAFVVGAVGVLQRILTGHTEAAYGSYVPWGLWVGLYTMLVGMSAGAFFLVSVVLGFRIERLAGVVRPALVVAVATFAGGMLAIWLDLGDPLLVWRLYLATGISSVMGWMAWLYAAYAIVLAVAVWQVVWRGRTSASPLVRRLGLLGAVLAVLFAAGEGALFGVVGARDFWNSGLTPILFLVEGVLSGIALVTLVGLLFGTIPEQAARTLGRFVLGALIVAIAIEAVDLAIGAYASIPAHTASVELVLSGPYWWAFWILHVIFGVAVPIVLLGFASGRRFAIAGATGLIAATALTTKLNLIVAGLAVPEFEELRTAYTGPGLRFDYFPTLMEWLVGLWVLAVVALTILAGQWGLRRLPIGQAT
jgi:molybdopterin-containing oxidoreductase family membrane subunit